MLFNHLPMTLLVMTSMFSSAFLAASETTYPICDLHSEEEITQYEQFDEIKVSKSGQFSENGLITLIESLSLESDNLVIFDLSDEYHGFVNGLPVYWQEYRDSAELEQELLAEALDAGHLWVQETDETNPLDIAVSEAITEKDVVVNLGHIYARYPVVNDNLPHKFVDQFVQIINDASSNHWIHFHDRTGGENVDTLVILADIIKNGRQQSLQEIWGKHEITIDLAKFSSEEEFFGYAQQKVDFISDFYAYCQEVPDFCTPWSKWMAKKYPCPTVHEKKYNRCPHRPSASNKKPYDAVCEWGGKITLESDTNGTSWKASAGGSASDKNGNYLEWDISHNSDGKTSGSVGAGRDKDRERDRNRD